VDARLLEDDTGTIVGRSLPLLLALRAARRAAADRRNVLIRGERGTGKELFARYLHQQSGPGENAAPYAVVNTPAISPELFASELFGHVRGAFTSAFEERTGRITEADGGDLFLDEIANMPAAVQTGALRVLECRQVSPVGGTSSRHVDVRFLSATNEDLEARAASGTFPRRLARPIAGGRYFVTASTSRPSGRHPDVGGAFRAPGRSVLAGRDDA
jgi:DNA-binding NtrC family response regulator